MNAALDRRRQRSRLVAFDAGREIASNGVPLRTASSGEDPERQSARRELAFLLEDAIDSLPDHFRGVFVLRDVDGMSTEQTAESLGLEPATVKTRLHRARSLLRERLAADFGAAALRAFPFGAERCDRLVAAVMERVASP